MQPSVIRMGVAIERSAGGGNTVRALACLPALVGSWRQCGGGILHMPFWAFPVNWDAVSRPDWIRPGTPVLNQWRLGPALLGELPLKAPIDSLFVYNSNPVSQGPAQAKTIQGLLREDLFTVVSEHFITDTARYADLVLPATMQAEQLDVMVTWGHLYISLNQPAIPAPGDCVPNSELFRRLANPAFEGRGESLRYFLHRAGPFGEVVRVDDVLNSNGIVERSPQIRRGHHHHRRAVFEGH